MRVLISVHPEISHLQPLVPLSWALRGAGHDVLVLVPANLASAVRRLGLDTLALSYQSEPAALLQAGLAAAGPAAVPIEAWDRPDEAFWGRISARFAANARTALDEYLAVARAWRPDLILVDPMEASGRIVSALIGVPAVMHRWGIDPLSGAFEAGLRERLAPDCEQLGLPGLPDPDLIVDPCPPALQLPHAPAGRAVRYIPANGAGEVPAWALEPSSPSRPRICVTLGGKMLELGLRRVLGWILDGVAGLDDAEAVLATPPLDPSDYAQVADRVVSVGPVPLSLFLGGCAAIVHHGGSGSGLTAAGLGVPQLVMPQHSDEFDYADRLAAYGAGISLDTFEAQSDVKRIRDALAALVGGESRYCDAAARLAREIRRMPAPAQLVPELERLAASR